MLAPYDRAAERAANAEERGSLDPIAEAGAGHRCDRLGPRDRCVARSERGRSMEDSTIPPRSLRELAEAKGTL